MSRHRHRWVEVGRVFAPSRTARAKGYDIEVLEALAFGVTSIELRCECGDVTERRLIGDHTPAPASPTTAMEEPS